MNEQKRAEFGGVIEQLKRGENLAFDVARVCWRQIITNEQPDLQQGAFLAALAMKGETPEEVKAAFEAIYELDTNKVELDLSEPVVENSGTGMDPLKTFNISTAASIIAAAAGVRIANHGARALSSKCGAVDVLEQVGVDMDCDVATVAGSVDEAGIGLFNGMSAEVHPRALFRILADIRFGTTLNIAGSLANPARPALAVRGVYASGVAPRIARVMQAIGVKRALVFHGRTKDSSLGIDELSTLGPSEVTELHEDGSIENYELKPEEFGIAPARYEDIASAEHPAEAARILVETLAGRAERAKIDIACLNAAPIMYLGGKAGSLLEGYKEAHEIVAAKLAERKLRDWVASQNQKPEMGLARLAAVMRRQ